MTQNRPRLLALAGLFICGVAWGSSLPLMKIAVSSGHKPMGLIFWQLVFLTIMLGAVIAWRRQRLPLRVPILIYCAVIGAIGTLIPNSFTYIAATELPGGILALCYATVPMFSLLIALTIRTERFAARRMAGISLGVAAMMMLAIPEARLPDAGMLPMIGLTLLAVACYGLESNVVERFAPRDLDPVAVLFVASLIAIPVAGVLAGALGQWIDLSAPWDAPEYALLGSTAAHAVAYTGYMGLVGMAGAVFASQVSYVVTLSGIGVSMVMLNESYPATAWAAIGVMLIGMALVQPRGRG